MNDALRDLLHHLSAGRAYTISALASTLGVDEALFEQMLCDLERAGYVQVVQAFCEASCQTCDLCRGCGLVHHGRIWTVTQKGQRLATA